MTYYCPDCHSPLNFHFNYYQCTFCNTMFTKEYIELHPNLTIHDQDDNLVHNPPHYKLRDDLEVQDIINAMGWTRHHRLAQAVEYILRSERKGQFEQDVRKAIKCLEMMLEVTE